MKIIKYILVFIFLLSLWVYIILSSMTPSLERDWTTDQEILTDIEILSDTISLTNIRSFRYTNPSEYTPGYFDGDYSISELSSLDYIIEPFGEIDGFAHTMLSFWFSDGRHIAVSSEIRKEVWESFHPISGFLNAYEIVYMIWDEEDLIKLRANARENTVIMYPIKISQTQLQQLFLSVMTRAQKLAREPEFYNSLTNTCTTSILSHINELKTDNNKALINWSKQIFLPSHSDTIAYEEWFIDTSLSLEEAREYYTINSLSAQHMEWEDYSKLIRKERR